jgi:DNA-directed RNA polymerase subunit RPC12/RpoP
MCFLDFLPGAIRDKKRAFFLTIFHFDFLKTKDIFYIAEHRLQETKMLAFWERMKEMLIKCPECGNEMTSDPRARCPRCGYQAPDRVKQIDLLVWFGAFRRYMGFRRYFSR